MSTNIFSEPGPALDYLRSTTKHVFVAGGGQIYNSLILVVETIHLYAVTMDDVASYQPSEHIFWSERLPWVKVDDGLPKHSKGLQNAADAGEELLN